MDATTEAAKEASSPAATGNDKCNDSGQQQQPSKQRDDSDDEEEDLCDVDFPIFHANTAASDDDAESSSEVRRVDKNGGSGNRNVSARVNKMDEDAIMRCFGLSVNAHIEGSGEVATFEPMPPKDDDAMASTTKDDSKMATNKSEEDSAQNPSEITQQREWSPASLPLPSWAKNIP